MTTYYKFGQKFGTSLRTASLAAGLLMLAACGDDKIPDGAGSSGSDTVPTAADSQPTIDPAIATSGTWGDIIYGDASAPVEIIEYASLTCPHCADFYTQEFPKLEADYIETGKVKFIYRNFLLNRLDLAASTVARCGDMETTKKLMKVYFTRQREWVQSEKPQDELAAIARRVGISRTEFDRCLSNTEMHKHIVEISTIGQEKFGVHSTPNLFVNGKKIENNSYESLKEAIDAAL